MIRVLLVDDEDTVRTGLRLVLETEPDIVVLIDIRMPPGPDPTPPTELALLTVREGEVLDLLGQGKSNAEIAETLFLGEATVKTHVARVLTKLQLRDRVQAVVFAYQNGLAHRDR